MKLQPQPTVALKEGISDAEIAARKEASAAKRPKHEKIDNTGLLDAFNLRVVHFVAERSKTTMNNNGKGMTVAWRPTNSNAVLEIATSLCKRGDVYSRKAGTRQAVANFQDGKTVFVPLIRGDPVLTFKRMFSRHY